jgi:hypothetical protein
MNIFDYKFKYFSPYFHVLLYLFFVRSIIILDISYLETFWIWLILGLLLNTFGFFRAFEGGR